MLSTFRSRKPAFMTSAAKPGSDKVSIYHLAPHILQPQLPASLLEFAGPVCDYSNRLVYLLGDYVEKYLLAVRRDIVEEDLAGKVRDDLLRTPELQRAMGMRCNYIRIALPGLYLLQCCRATVASRAGDVASPVSVLTSGPAGGASLLASSVLI
jgi:hypothetical protein